MDFFDISTSYLIPESQQEFFGLYIEYFKKLIKSATPKEFYDLGPNVTEDDLKQAYKHYEAAMPIIHCCKADKAPCSLSVTTIIPGYYTWGFGRFSCDILNRWLIPGKHTTILVSQGLNFVFKKRPDFNFYCHNSIVKINDQQELEIVKENFDRVVEEMRLIIKGTAHARRIMANAYLPMEQKRALIQDYLLTLLNRSAQEFDQTVFDQVHQVFVHASAEYNLSRIKSNFAKLSYKAPQILDRDVFTEIQHYVILFRDSFMYVRSQFHLYRIICYMYIFRKWIINQLHDHPNERHMPVKLIPAKIESEKAKRTVIGLVIGMNHLHENELFESHHILAAVKAHIPDVQEVENSYVIDARRGSGVFTLYMEIEKKDGSSFTIEEIRLLKTKLAKELPSRIERRALPLFVHRNEEEVMRNILILARQLKFVRDIPQVIVNYDKQTASSLCFTVILLRLLKPGTKSLKANQKRLKFFEYDTKIVGYLRKKYPKEANVFEIRLDKHQFLRDDYSIDMYKARESVIDQLVEIFGEVRDFNGGMISKQSEALSILKKLLKKRSIDNDFTLENFFYSITPTYMQSVIPPEHLEKLFMMLLELTEGNFDEVPFHFKSCIFDGVCLIAIGAPQNSYQEPVSTAIEALQIPGSELCATTVNIYDISALCYLCRPNDNIDSHTLINTAKEALNKWKNTLKQPEGILI